MELLYTVNRVLVSVLFVIGVIFLGVRVFCWGGTLFVGKRWHEQRLSKWLSRYSIRIRWLVVGFIMLILWCQQSRLLFDKVTECAPGASREDIVGTWTTRGAGITFNEDGGLSLRGSIAQRVKAQVAGPYHWEVEDDIIEVRGVDDVLVAQWKVIRFNRRLRVCTDFDWSDGVPVRLGLWKTNCGGVK